MILSKDRGMFALFGLAEKGGVKYSGPDFNPENVLSIACSGSTPCAAECTGRSATSSSSIFEKKGTA